MDPDIEIVCFDCDHTMSVESERDALYLAEEHSDSTGHKLVIKRYSRAVASTIWQITPDHCVEV